MKTRHPKAVQREIDALSFTYIKHWATDDTDLPVTNLVDAIGDALECGDCVRENVPEDFNSSSWVMLVVHGHITAAGRRRLRAAVFAKLGLPPGRGGFVLAAMAASDDECHREHWGLTDTIRCPAPCD